MIVQPRFLRFGRLLRDARVSRGINQEQLAAALKIGQQAVSSWERGVSRPATPALLDRLAVLFPEYDVATWREVTGYHERAAPHEPSKPVRPLRETLPLGQLTFQQFQGFCALLLEFVYGDKASVNQFGVEGDTQDGIDIEVRFSDGRYETFQCKQQKNFGPEKVRRALKAHKVSCDRAVILLSRKATAAARKVISKRGKWDLWDTEDIARKIRALPLAKQKRIVDAYFRSHRSDFLGINDAGALETPEEHFAPLLHRDHAFSHAWTLAGRDPELERLIALTARDPRDVTLLVGAGGIGKSRLIRALVDAYKTKFPGREIFLLPPDRTLSASDLDVLSDQPSLLVIEDAHEHPQIVGLVATLARAAHPIRLLFTVRPYALQLIRSETLRNGFRADDEGTVSLQSLTVDQAECIAHEILTDRRGPVWLARVIARLTSGSPLALVAGAYLVATEKIDPRVLNNAAVFRDQLFGRFRDVFTGQIGPEQERDRIRNALNLVALCQPVDADSPSLMRLAELVLQVPTEKVKQALQRLHEAGVLIRRGRLLRIAPDLLAEYILEDVCVLKAGQGSTGYAERVMSACDEDQLANILFNVSKLDWRLSDVDESASRLADAVWMQIDATYEDSSVELNGLIEAVARAAYYQPARALRFYDRLKECGRFHGELTMLLKRAAMSIQHIDHAARRLWDSGQTDLRSLNSYPSHPIRVLHELAAIEPDKPVEYSARVVGFAMQLIKDGHGGTGEHSVFGALRAALVTEGHTTELRGHSVVMSGFSVRRDAVASLRHTIIGFLLEQLTVADLQTAAQAAAVFQDALRYPHGVIGGEVTNDDRRSWSSEFVDTLQRIHGVVKDGQLDPFVAIELQHAVNWHAQHGDALTLDEAQAVLEAIPQTLGYRVSLALWDGWGHLKLEAANDVHGAMIAWQQELKGIASEFSLAFPNCLQVVDFLRERLRALRSTKEGRSSPEVFIGVLVAARPEIAAAISEAVILDAEDPLRDVFGAALCQLAMVDPKRALVLAATALNLGDTGLSRQVSSAYGTRFRFRQGILLEERALAERLIQDDDDFTVRAIIHGIAAQAPADRAWSLATLLSAPISRSADTADSVFVTFDRPGELPFESLEELVILAFIERLTACPSLDGHWIQGFLAAASRRTPAGVVRLLIERIERDAQDATGKFQAMPYFWDGPGLKFREAGDLPAHLKTIREWLLAGPRSAVTGFWGPRLYAVVAAGYDQVVLRDLDAWAKSGDMEKLSVVARILSEAPTGFVFDQRVFVEDLLEHAETVGQKCVDKLRASLWGSAIAGMRDGEPGKPYPQDEARRDRAAEALGRLSRRSPAWSLFDGLKREAERDIRRKRQEDEERFEE